MWKLKAGKQTEAEELARIGDQLQRLSADNRRMFDELNAMQQRSRSLARSVWRIQEDERRRLARELHDGVGQSLTALRHRLDRLPAGSLRDEVIDMLVQVIEDVREMSRLLRPPVLDDLGLEPALRWLGRRVREGGGPEVIVDAVGLADSTLEPELETLLFRVTQEALNNAVRHAGASCVSVSGRRLGNRLELTIRDDGVGFDPESLREDPEAAGVGLAGMRDRVELFGGDFAICSAPGQGTTLAIGLALDPPVADEGESR